jgi:hypothetical protein
MRSTPHYITAKERVLITAALREKAYAELRAAERQPEGRLRVAMQRMRLATECSRLAALFDTADMVDVYPLPKN